MEEYSFQEVMKQFKRGCPGNCATATGCPMYPACNIEQCRKIAFERPAEFERLVMSWAEAHPEPRCPTWVEWMRYTKLLVPDHYSFFAGETLGKKAYEPIPADIAEKLGITPKEAT